MNLIVIVRSDVKIVLRDKSLLAFLFIPLLFMLVVRFLLPQALIWLPFLGAYQAAVLSVFCLINSAISAFIFCFVMLDEKDNDLFPVFKVLPFSFLSFLTYRVVLVTIVAFVGTLLILLLGGIPELSIPQKIVLAFSSSLIAPTWVFLVVSLANNKVEGLTIFKMTNFLLLLPVASLFIERKLSFFFGILPHFWTFELFQRAFTGERLSLFLLISVMAHSLLTYLALLFFLKRGKI